MRKGSSKSVFDLLAKPVREGLAELGFAEPTLPQTMGVRPVLSGKDVLLIAPTGSGKTEAVLLPVFSKMVEEGEGKGVAVVYITPLRALNRDLLKRLKFWSDRLGISVEVRHGDTEAKVRRRQARFPPQMLVTTPETLQAILPGSQMRKHLGHVRYVVIDEVHELASSKRGAQLTVALERLREVAGGFQRIGLSATVGNPEEVAKFIVGMDGNVEVVKAALAKGIRYRVEYPTPKGGDYGLAEKLRTSPGAASRIRRLRELIDGHRSTLVFVNSRTIAEMLGFKFGQLSRRDVAVHHGSLSREERVSIEDDFKAGVLKAIICTSTLELGIDIGNVDLTVQYMSPRQVGTLIQRVGRSGHRLDRVSEGDVITVYPDDTLEAIAAVRSARNEEIEPVLFHENALDVLAHQTAGVLMDRGKVALRDLLSLVKGTYPFRGLDEKTLLRVVRFLENFALLRFDEERMTLTRTRRTREYYYGNLSMIPDEKRYPVVNVISDRRVGTLGDEFMALHSRVGLNFIMRGKVWRIVQIEDETGTVHVVPSEDPFAAIPGWDGEILPVPFDLAQKTGETRETIGKLLQETHDVKAVAERLAEKLATDKASLLESVKEIDEQLKQGAPLPTHNRVLVEVFDKYVIVHACFGEVVNRTLGGVFDSILSERDEIVGWWTDGYRILIETPRTVLPQEVERLPAMLFHLTDEEVDAAFEKYVRAKFPYGYKMKFVAERFGAIPRGKTMGSERLSQLMKRFEGTPIYDETLREAMLEKADLKKAKEVIRAIRDGEIKVSTVYRSEKPTPLAYHILSKYADISELMAPEELLLSNVDRMKESVEARTATLLCMKCGQWTSRTRVKNLPGELRCKRCGSGLITLLYPGQDPDYLKELLQRRRGNKALAEEELRELTQARRKADLILSYGKDAVKALEVKGVGPETASRVLGKMHTKQNELYTDLLKAKIQYLRTREYWENRKNTKTS